MKTWHDDVQASLKIYLYKNEWYNFSIVKKQNKQLARLIRCECHNALLYFFQLILKRFSDKLITFVLI